MDFLLQNALASLLGALTSVAFIALRVLPGKVSRTEVEEMLATQPLQYQFTALRDQVGQGHEELRGIRGELVGLRADVVRLTTTLELTLKNRG